MHKICLFLLLGLSLSQLPGCADKVQSIDYPDNSRREKVLNIKRLTHLDVKGHVKLRLTEGRAAIQVLSGPVPSMHMVYDGDEVRFEIEQTTSVVSDLLLTLPQLPHMELSGDTELHSHGLSNQKPRRIVLEDKATWYAHRGHHMLASLLLYDESKFVSQRWQGRIKDMVTYHRAAAVLDGKLKVERIKQYDRSHIKAHWVDSPCLHIDNEDSSRLELAGTVDCVHGHFTNDAKADLIYLRTKTAFVKTEHNATLDIATVDAQFMQAVDNSSIHYHNDKTQSLSYEYDSGRVLAMR